MGVDIREIREWVVREEVEEVLGMKGRGVGG